MALTPRWDLDLVNITGFCRVCEQIFLPGAVWAGRHAEELMKVVRRMESAPEAPPEAYERLYD